MSLSVHLPKIAHRDVGDTPFGAIMCRLQVPKCCALVRLIMLAVYDLAIPDDQKSMQDSSWFLHAHNPQGPLDTQPTRTVSDTCI